MQLRCFSGLAPLVQAAPIFLTRKQLLWKAIKAMSSEETSLAATAVDVPLFFNDNSLRMMFDIVHFSTVTEVGGALLPQVQASRYYPYCIGHFLAASHTSHLACVESKTVRGDS